jgi:hypothetical protein
MVSTPAMCELDTAMNAGRVRAAMPRAERVRLSFNEGQCVNRHVQHSVHQRNALRRAETRQKTSGIGVA